jgi:hypothetical protein
MSDSMSHQYHDLPLISNFRILVGLKGAFVEEVLTELADLGGEHVDLLADLEHFYILQRKDSLSLVEGSSDDFFPPRRCCLQGNQFLLLDLWRI